MSLLNQVREIQQSRYTSNADWLKKALTDSEFSLLPSNKLDVHLSSFHPDTLDIICQMCVDLLYSDNELYVSINEYFREKPEIPKWFVSFESLVKEFECIENAGISIEKITALICINDFLVMKFIGEFCKQNEEFNNLGSTDCNVITEVDNYLKRKRYRESHGKNKKKNIDNKFENLLVDISGKTDFSSELEIFTNVLKSKGSDILRPLWSDCFSYDKTKMNRNQYYRSLYNLCKLIYKNVVFLTEDEFDISGKYYGASYPVYQAIAVRNLIKPR